MRIRLAVLVAAMAVSAGAARAEKVLTVSDDTTNSPVSGLTASKFVLKLPGGTPAIDEYGLKEIGMYERSDEPCEVWITGTQLGDPSGVSEEIKLNKCGGNAIDMTYRSEGFGGRAYVSAIRVCLNNDHTRVKGFELKGRVVATDGSLSAASDRPRHELTNCRDWVDWAECPSGQIATGLNLHYEGGSTPRSIKGIGLLCRTVVATESTAPPALSGPAVETGRAGVGGGTAEVVKPGNVNSNVVTSIIWAEKNDRPCYLKVKGQSASEQTVNANDVYNGCGGDPRGGSEREAGRGSGVDYPASGIRVCIKNERVKGIELEYWNAADERRFTYEGGADTQPNCRVGDREWTDWRRCDEGSVAIGVKAFFQPDGGQASLRAIALLCRRLGG